MRRTLTTLLAGTLLALPIATPALAAAPEQPACSDQVDNDGDGFADFGGLTGDPSCTSPRDGDEASGAVLSLQSPPDAGVEGRPPALTVIRHSVTVRNDGLVPQRVTLVQDHAFSPTPVPVIGGISAPSTTAGSCVSTGADIECDLGMVLPGESATVESTVTAICLPFPIMSFDVAVSTSVTGSPMRVTATTDTNAATTTYHVACRPLGPPPPPLPLPF